MLVPLWKGKSTLASGSPVAVDEHGYMEYEAAGAWRGSPTELVQCETSDLLVPANAEYIIEGVDNLGLGGPFANGRDAAIA